MIKFKWDNWRILVNYTETQCKRFKNVQSLYARLIKKNDNLAEALVHTFLESDEKGVPLRGVTAETMNPFERYTDSHPLVSYANMLQTKILKYLLARLENMATYNNDAQSLLCLQMLHDFRECFVKAAITDTLLVTVDNWKKFVTRLKVATIPGTKDPLFPHHEENNLNYTLQWLLSNVNGLLDQVYEEIQLELSRRSIADYLDGLAHSTKVTIELGFEYVAHILTYEPLPLDFNLANFYDKNIDIDLHKKLHAKIFFQCLYQFASSSAIKDLFFGTKTVHYELQGLMSANSVASLRIAPGTNEQGIAMPDSPLMGLKKAVFLTQKGEVNTAIMQQLCRQPKAVLMAEETGVLALFCQPNQTIYLQTALKSLGYLEIISRLTSLTRVASYLLHQDGSLLARKETKSQIQLFIEIYQTLLTQLFSAINKLKESFDQQLDDKQRHANQPFYCNPNLELCNVLGDKLTGLQRDCKNTLGQIQIQLTNIDQHRRELNELLCWFKQEWFGFMGNHSWLLDSGQQHRVLELRQGEMALAKQNTPLALLAATEAKRPTLTIDVDTPIEAKALFGLLQSEVGRFPQCQGVRFATSMDFQDKEFMSLSIRHLIKGQYLFCVIKTTNDTCLALLAVLRNQEDKLVALYCDARGNFALNRGVENYCKNLNINLTKLVEAYQSANQDDAIHVYENIMILLQAPEAQFSADYLWQQIIAQGLDQAAVVTLKRCSLAQQLMNWQSTQLNKPYDEIVITAQLQKATTKLELINPTGIKRTTLDALLSTFPNLMLHLGPSCTQITADDLFLLAKTHQARFSLQCFSSIKNQMEEVPLGRRLTQPVLLIDRCIRYGITHVTLWNSLYLIINAEVQSGQADIESGLNTRMREKNNSFLHVAALCKQAVICEYLIKQGIDKNAKNEQGYTGLDSVIESIKQNPSENTAEMRLVIKTLINHNVTATSENIQKAKGLLSQVQSNSAAPRLGMFST